MGSICGAPKEKGAIRGPSFEPAILSGIGCSFGAFFPILVANPFSSVPWFFSKPEYGFCSRRWTRFAAGLGGLGGAGGVVVSGLARLPVTICCPEK